MKKKKKQQQQQHRKMRNQYATSLRCVVFFPLLLFLSCPKIPLHTNNVSNYIYIYMSRILLSHLSVINPTVCKRIQSYLCLSSSSLSSSSSITLASSPCLFFNSMKVCGHFRSLFLFYFCSLLSLLHFISYHTWTFFSSKFSLLSFSVPFLNMFMVHSSARLQPCISSLPPSLSPTHPSSFHF